MNAETETDENKAPPRGVGLETTDSRPSERQMKSGEGISTEPRYVVGG